MRMVEPAETYPLYLQNTTASIPTLPSSYTTVPAVYLKPSSTAVPKAVTSPLEGHLTTEMVKETSWVEQGIGLLQVKELEKGQAISWAAYHASIQPEIHDPPSIIAMLPLFFEKADSPAMIKHGLDILRDITHFLNPGQIPILACDCPIFAVSKYIQWKWPDYYGEDKLVIMFGGLHLEKSLWNTLGDLLDGSGWTAAIIDSNVATSGTAESFLKACHITRTRHVHQVTAMTLSKLQRDAFTCRSDQADLNDFESWRQRMIKESPTFQFWDLILWTEILILVFIRAHRERNLPLYVESLEALMFLFFALDHYNYSRWITIHIRDMKALPPLLQDEFGKYWVVNKSQHRFSAIPIDQVHEQENARVKGKGGVIGLTESPAALQKWMISGPEQARLLTEFETEYLPEEDPEVNYMHHEEGLSSQRSFQNQVTRLVQVISDFGNPFEDDCPELLLLHTRNCADDSVVSTVRTVEIIGKEQYERYKSEVVEQQQKSIHDAIKKTHCHYSNHQNQKSRRMLRKWQVFAMMQASLAGCTLQITNAMGILLSSFPMKIRCTHQHSQT